jgi:hypothetical protein
MMPWEMVDNLEPREAAGWIGRPDDLIDVWGTPRHKPQSPEELLALQDAMTRRYDFDRDPPF